MTEPYQYKPRILSRQSVPPDHFSRGTRAPMLHEGVFLFLLASACIVGAIVVLVKVVLQ